MPGCEQTRFVASGEWRVAWAICTRLKPFSRMYNGIGVTSVRGTGTSGYVQTNRFNIRHRPGPREFNQDALAQPQASREPNKGIIDHNKKRELEIQLMRERDRLEDAG